jgi:pimeloyl-ACP methyl ester carboxylesterase
MAFMDRDGVRLYYEDTGGIAPAVLFLHGAGGLIWPELSDKVHQHVPGSSFVRVEAAGHSTYFERADVFNREVGAFLKAHRP